MNKLFIRPAWRISIKKYKFSTSLQENSCNYNLSKNLAMLSNYITVFVVWLHSVAFICYNSIYCVNQANIGLIFLCGSKLIFFVISHLIGRPNHYKYTYIRTDLGRKIATQQCIFKSKSTCPIDSLTFNSTLKRRICKFRTTD